MIKKNNMQCVQYKNILDQKITTNLPKFILKEVPWYFLFYSFSKQT